MKIITENKNAKRLYDIEEKLEAGIELLGPEVKAIREGRVNIRDGYARIKNNELFLTNVHISEYKNSSLKNYDPMRDRKLLVHKREIKRLIGKQQEKGYTIVPLKMYWKNNKIKVELGIGKGKSKIDRREDIKDRESKRAIDRAFKKNYLKMMK